MSDESQRFDGRFQSIKAPLKDTVRISIKASPFVARKILAINYGAVDGTRTRDPRRDRPVL